jgi:hypothetical protein
MLSDNYRLCRIVIAALATFSLSVPVLHAMPANLSQLTGEKFTSAVEQVNFSAPEPSRPTGNYDILFQTLLLYKAELNDTPLPGPRYMAYGPSAITFAASPFALIILALVIALCSVVIYIIRRRRRQEGAELSAEENKE